MADRDQPDSSQTGALIVGGGPAGLAAAIALRQRGIDCVVVEARGRDQMDKACGEGLMPDSQHVLAQLGIHISLTDGAPFRGIRFANATHHVEARFPHGAGIGVRRTRLHALMAARAQELGVDLRWNSRIQLPAQPLLSATGEPFTAAIDGSPIRFCWLIGADGQASTVRRWAGLEPARKQSQRLGFRTHYRIAPCRQTDLVEVHWGPTGQLYITPVAPDCVGVVFLTRHRHIDRDNLLAEFPAVASRLAGAEIASQPRGAVCATCKLRRVARGRIALVGDASGSADSITGEGLALAFRQAVALADCVAAGSLEPYNAAHRRIARLPHIMAALMLTLDRSPAFQARAMHALSANPALFRELLSAHIGAASLPTVFLRRAPSFGWSFLTGAS